MVKTKPLPMAERAFQANELLRNLNPQFRASQLALLLAVYRQEGQIMRDLAIETGLTMSGLSRCFDNLSSSGRSDKKGYPMDLLRAERGRDDRVLLIYLTGRGRQLIEAYLSILEG